jgi:MerR family transcriptional regulator, copper efflux regulator
MPALTTGALAKQGGVNLESIRYYERRGLLPKPPRTDAGYRMYTDDALRRVRFIKRAQAIGFTLREIRELLGLRVKAGSTCDDVRRKAEAKVAEIDRKRRQLAAMKKALVRLVASCDRSGPASACTFLGNLESESAFTI